MRFDVLTLFPDMFSGYMSESLLKLAIARGLIEVRLHDIRNWAHDRHKTVDDKPFGGGPGMLMKVEPVVECVEAVQAEAPEPAHLVMLTPQGRRLDQSVVEELAGHKRLMLLCGRYEGFDERIKDILKPDEISIGDYVLNGGEVAAMVLIDSIMRLVPGVLGDDRSCHQDSFSGEERLLEFGQYTRPREYRGHKVPQILLEGNHPEIAQWRREQQVARTARRRNAQANQTDPGTAGSETTKPPVHESDERTER